MPPHPWWTWGDCEEGSSSGCSQRPLCWRKEWKGELLRPFLLGRVVQETWHRHPRESWAQWISSPYLWPGAGGYKLESNHPETSEPGKTNSKSRCFGRVLFFILSWLTISALLVQSGLRTLPSLCSALSLHLPPYSVLANQVLLKPISSMSTLHLHLLYLPSY